MVLVHGSGPQDKDETLGENKPFKDLAEGLAEKGIAVYRYDKISFVYGNELMGDKAFTLYDETVRDAAAAVSLLSEQEMIDPGRIFVLGHSLGGQAIPAIAQALKLAEEDGKTGDDIRTEEETRADEGTPTVEKNQAAGYIFLAAPARDLVTIMKEQYDFLYTLSPAESEEEKAQQEAVYAMLDLLKSPEDLPEDTAFSGAYPAYWQYLAQYDTLELAKDIDVPCLVLQGEEDYQVTMEEFALWQEAFADDPQWSFISYPGLTHIFSEGQKENGPTDYLGKKHVDEKVIEDIAAFINE